MSFEKGVRQLVLTLPVRSKQAVLDWLQGLSDPIDDRNIYLKGIDHSYYYEETE